MELVEDWTLAVSWLINVVRLLRAWFALNCLSNADFLCSAVGPPLTMVELGVLKVNWRMLLQSLSNLGVIVEIKLSIKPLPVWYADDPVVRDGNEKLKAVPVELELGLGDEVTLRKSL